MSTQRHFPASHANPSESRGLTALRGRSSSFTIWEELAMVIALSTFAAATRLWPHEPNFTAVGAAALLGGALLKNRRWVVFLVPLASMLLSDIALNFAWHGRWAWSISSAAYVSFALSALIGSWLRARENAYRVGGAAIASSLVFYVVSNFAVWQGGKLYSHDANGLVACYVAAIPFLTSMLKADLVYSFAFFGLIHVYDWSRSLVASRIGARRNIGVV